MAMNTSSSSSDEYARTVTAVGMAIGQGDLRRAYELANWAIGRGMEGRIIYNARALAYQASGRFNEAIIDFRHALKFSPNDAAIHAAIGATYMAQNDLPEAIRAFDLAIAQSPNDPAIQVRLAKALVLNEQYGRADTALERTIELDPNNVEALADLASLAARQGQYDRAKALADNALAISPGYAVAHYALALVETNRKQYADVEQRLRFLVFHRDLDIQTRGGMCSLLGDALEAQGRHAEAFETYMRGNQFLLEENRSTFKNARGSQAVQHITAYFENTTSEKWTPGKPAIISSPGPAQHVFLLGFMRSGTTLLEQVLASNSKVVALEEKATLDPLNDTFLTSNQGLDHLASLQGAELDAVAAGYWERVREHAPNVAGKILVDKQPLNTVRIPIIARLFPEAKILFSIRDPRDVVFSCYRRPFRVNTTMFEFLDLEDAARMYASIMNLAKLYRQKLTLNLMDHYYEDIVTDFETSVRAVCDFVGLEWADSMRDFSKNAPQININSPSAKQVRRPLYGEGIGQWRKYAEQLQPIMPILRPWVEEFGYSVE